MKIHTPDLLLDVVQEDLAWRKHEIAILSANVRRATDVDKEFHVRAGVALLYAHWEGGVKSYARKYVEFLNSQRLSYSDLTDALLGSALHGKLASFGAARTASAHREMGGFVMNSLTDRANIDLELIRTESNLSGKLFLDILIRLGISEERYLTTLNLVDVGILKPRNSVAHGDYANIDADDFLENCAQVRITLNDFANDVVNCAISRSYLRTPTANK